MKLFRAKKGKCVDDFVFAKDTTFTYRMIGETIMICFFNDNKIGLKGVRTSFKSQRLSVEPIMGNFYPCQIFFVEVSNQEESVKVLYEILATPFYCKINVKEINSNLNNISADDVRKSFEENKKRYSKDLSRKWRGILKTVFNKIKYFEACKEYFEFVKQEKNDKAYAECSVACSENQLEYDEEVNNLLNY